jgi:broad specificity phosphatase PhoE
MMTKIFLCRHGQDEDNSNGLLNGHRNTPLTDLGRQQAHHVADKIAASMSTFDAILSSPLQRAHHTALEIASRRQQEVLVEPLLIERDFGALTGRPLTDIEEFAKGDILATDRVTYFLSADGSETFDALYERAQRVVDKVRSSYEGKTVLLVCHGDIGKMILAVCKRISWREGLMYPYFANTEVIEL